MTRLPITVQAGGQGVHRHVAQYARGTSFTKTAPGGDHTAAMKLGLDPNTLPDLDSGDRVLIHNPRTGRPLWGGYVDSTGRSAAGFDLTVDGGRVLATDERRPLVYVDRQTDAWITEKAATTAVASTVSTSDDPTGVDAGTGLLQQFPPGQPLATNAAIKSTYVFGDQQFGGLVASKKSGLASTDYMTTLVTQGDSGVVFADLAPLGAVETTLRSHTFWAGPPAVGQIAEGIRRLSMQFMRDGAATNVATDTVWTWWKPTVFGRTKSRAGFDRNGWHGTVADGGSTFAYFVVEDVHGRLLLNACDPDLAVIDLPVPPDGTAITQLAYRDPVHAATILDDLTLWEPDLLWAIDAPATMTGRHRFRCVLWPTTPRYTITSRHGFKRTARETDYANRITVSWSDESGRRQSVVVTSTVPELGTRTRDADPIELPDGVGSSVDAVRIGTETLAALNREPRAGTGVIDAPLLDMTTGLMVEAYEIEPGSVALVQETGDVLRLTEMTYDADAGAASITLGEPAMTLDQRVQRLARRRR